MYKLGKNGRFAKTKIVKPEGDNSDKKLDVKITELTKTVEDQAAIIVEKDTKITELTKTVETLTAEIAKLTVKSK